MIRQGDRVLAVGNTGSGKSEALAHLFARHDGQRVLIDVGDAYDLGPAALEEGAWEGDDADAIDWTQRTIRYVPRNLSAREYDELYARIFTKGDLLVWLDEAEGPTTAHSTPPWLRKTIKQGRKRRITHLAATQRPAGVERSLINQSEHAYVFRMVDPDDIEALSFRMRLRANELADALAGLEHPPGVTWGGFLYHRIGDPSVPAMPPIPGELIEFTRQHVRIPA